MATKQKPEEKKPAIMSLTYVFRPDPVTSELRELTADEFQQLIDKGIDPKHTTAEEVYTLCGWWPAIKTIYYVKGQENFITELYLNWTSAYETDK